MKYLSPTEFAKRLNVATVTVRKWAQKGLLNPIITPGGHRRYTMKELERFALEYNIPYNDEDNTKLRLLIVDDDAQQRKYLTARFKSSARDQIETEQAEDGFEAGHKLHTFKPNIVLLDLMMPGIDGFEVCRYIKEHDSTKHIRIIAMTGLYDTENITRIVKVGAEICLPKPIDFKALFSAIGISATQHISSTQPRTTQ